MTQRQSKSKSSKKGGRPRKFTESSRPITVTLADSTLKLLASVNSDRALAIDQVTKWATASQEIKGDVVELIEVEPGKSLISVAPSKYLRQISFLRMLEITPARHILVIPSGMSVTTLEVAITDFLTEHPTIEEYEKDLLTKLSKILAMQRRSQSITKAEILLFDSKQLTNYSTA